MKRKKSLLTLCLLFLLGVACLSELPFVFAKEESTVVNDSLPTTNLSKSVLNKEEVSSVVQGSDGLLYVVADEEDPSQLISSDNKEIAMKTEDDFTAVEVGIDANRQKKADKANEEISDFEEINLNNVESLQSAINSEDLKFIEEDEVATELAKTKNLDESEEVLKQTRTYYAEKILNLTNNLNDIPSNLKKSKTAILAKASKTVSETNIYPPSGYPWLMYIIRSNGYAYTEDRGIRRVIDGKDAFCLQAGVTAGKTYTDSGNSYLSASQREIISSIISAYKELGGWTNNDAGKQRWMAATILVWENSKEKPKSVTITPNYKSGVNDWKSKISTLATKIRTKPTWDATSKTVYEGEKATFTVKNSGGEHKLKVESVSGGGKATVSGSKLTVDTSGSTGTQIVVKMTKGSTELNPTTVWENGSYQKLVTGSFYVNTSVTVNVKRKGTVDVLKVDKDTQKALANATFRFTYDGKTKDVKTGTDGKAKLGERLKAGSVVKAKEIIAPSGYKLNGTEFSITVGENKNVTKTWTNERLAGAVELTKIADIDQKSLDGVVFTLYKSDGSILQDNLKTDSSGQIKVKDLSLGSYYFKEKTPLKGFETDSKNYTFTITADVTEAKPVKLTITNRYKLSASKTVSDKNETNKTNNTWTATSDDYLQYDLTSSVVEKLGSRFLTNFMLEDQIDFSKVSISSVQVISQGIDVTSQFSITQNVANSKVTAVAKDTTLSVSSFYGKSYTLRTKMKLNSSVINTQNKVALSFAKNGLVKSGAVTVTSNTVTTTLPVFKITVNHVIETSKTLLKQESEVKYDGESYEYKPFENLFDAKGNRYRSKETRKGIVAGKDIVLEIPYYLPSVTINADKIEIFTGKASTTGNLKATLSFSKSISHEAESKNVKYRLSVSDQKQKKVVFQKDFLLAEYKDTLSFDLPTVGLIKGEKVPYSVTLTILQNPDKVKAETETIDFSTFAYTASEKVLTNSDLKNGKITYSAVVKTEATRKTKSYLEKKETLEFNYSENTSSKTGYGVPVDLEPIFASEIQDTPTLVFTFLTPSKLIDSYFDLQYPSSNNTTHIPLERTENLVMKQGKMTVTSTKFEFPRISVERKTGALYTQEQVKNPTKQIKNELLDGGRKFYLPIWADIGKYNLSFQSNMIGRNFIQVNLNQSLDVYAYMYATMDSKTKQEDELLLMPTYPDSDIPKGWSESEVTWLKGK